MTATQTHRPRSPVRFELPQELSATMPPEARGSRRDQVRLLVGTPETVHHTRFAQLGEHLAPGDLVVVNTSATLPAAVDGRRADGREVVVHVAGPAPPDATSAPSEGWLVELRRPDARGPVLDATVGESIRLADGAALRLEVAHPDTARTTGSRLWHTVWSGPRPLADHLELHGRPIAYGYVPDRWPLEAYQTIFGRHPGSSEMVSAARPFSPELVTDLVARGVGFATVTLHTGVSSLEGGEAPQAERFEVPEHTARLVDLTRRAGGRVVAVGTTVTRALESATDADGTIRGAAGWTDLVLGPDRPARIVTGLVTGWHESDASHLSLLEAVGGAELLERVYAAALDDGYLWHEFGDSCLLLP